MLKGKRHSYTEEGSSYINVPGCDQWMEGGLEALNSRHLRRYSRSVNVMTSFPRYGIVQVRLSRSSEAGGRYVA